MRLKLLSLFTVISSLAFAQTWDPVASLPSSADVRHHPVTFSIAGQGYLVTGANPSTGVLKDFYRYDPVADAWTTMPDFPGLARGFSYGVSSGDKGYMGFGYYENPVTLEGTILNDLWEYDPVTEEWTELASCPCLARFHPAMVYLDNKIFVGLGGSEFGDRDDWWEYDIATDTWTEREDFPGSVRHHPYYFGLGDYVYVGFGHHTSSIFNDFYRYDPATDTWLELNEFPDQGRVAGTQFSYLGRGYILSGQGETHSNLPTGEFWEYVPETDSWNSMTAHPSGGRWAPGNFMIENKVYFTCGEANTGEKRDMLVYEFEGFANVADEEITTVSFVPNPSNGPVFITGTETFNTANIFDASGRLIMTTEIINGHMNLETVLPGMYLVQLLGDKGSVTKKIVIE